MKQAENHVNQAVNRTYKDRLFKMIFSNKKELLELYNAANGTHYDNPESLEINTLENAIYLSMRNDISFIIDSWLTLYEHQSTYSPNYKQGTQPRAFEQLPDVKGLRRICKQSEEI